MCRHGSTLETSRCVRVPAVFLCCSFCGFQAYSFATKGWSATVGLYVMSESGAVDEIKPREGDGRSSGGW
jgi:hypothetical protein